MKILYLSTWYPYPPDNGSKLRAFYLLKALAKRHEVTALAFLPQPNPYAGVLDRFNCDLPVVAVPDDPYRYVKLPQWAKYLSLSPVAYRPSAAMWQALQRESTSGPWDAVVAIQIPVAQYAVQAPAAVRVIDVDTALTYQMRERCQGRSNLLPRASAWVSWQKTERYERRMLRQFDAAAVCWQSEADYLEEIIDPTSCQVTVVPNGVDCTHNYPGLVEPSPDNLVYSGSLTYSANFDAMRWFLAEVYPAIKAGCPGVRMLITGSTQGVDLSQLAIDESVQLTGFVEDIRTVVAGATVCVVPLRQGGGTRLKILEAMALGTPIVSTQKGAEGLDVRDGEHLVLADTPGDFAQATLALLANATLRRQLAAQARCLVEKHYDWTAICQRFVATVETAAERQHRGNTSRRSQ